jgi:hypothetical protein
MRGQSHPSKIPLPKEITSKIPYDNALGVSLHQKNAYFYTAFEAARCSKFHDKTVINRTRVRGHPPLSEDYFG